MPKSTTLLLSAAIVSTLLLAACQAPTESTTGTPEVTAQMTPTPTQQSSTGTTTGKEVTVMTSYPSPAGEEKVGFTLVVDDQGVITDAKTQVFGIQPISVERQTKFSQGLPDAVVGKKLSDLTKIDRVGGSSLTTGAFNDALKDLKSKV